MNWGNTGLTKLLQNSQSSAISITYLYSVKLSIIQNNIYNSLYVYNKLCRWMEWCLGQWQSTQVWATLFQASSQSGKFTQPGWFMQSGRFTHSGKFTLLGEFTQSNRLKLPGKFTLSAAGQVHVVGQVHTIGHKWRHYLSSPVSWWVVSDSMASGLGPQTQSCWRHTTQWNVAIRWNGHNFFLGSPPSPHTPIHM